MVNANSIFGGMLTTQGAAKKTNCDALGIPWEPRYMLIGDANGTDPVPNPAQTQLVNQVYRAQINQLYVSPSDANILIAELVLPPDVGGWWIRELALEDKDGVFCAVANAAPSYKPLLAQGSGRNQVVRMHIITSGTANIQLKIDPSVVLATRQYVDLTINGLLPANKVAGTYTKVMVNDRGVFVSGSNPSTLAGMGITDTYTKTQIEAMIAQASALPVGAQMSFPVNKIAPGFLERDGSVKSIALYPDLAAYLDGAFNRGDEGAGNFRLPESRGESERGWDHGRGVDTGRAVGSWQQATGVYPLVGSDGNVLTVNLTDADGALNPVPHPSYTLMTKTANYSTMPVASQFVRTRNVAVVMCIKAWNAPINQGNIDIAALATLVDTLSLNGPVVGSMRGDRMLVDVASATGNFVAQEIIVGDSNGKTRKLKNFNKSVVLSSAVKGIGAMDIGAAPVAGYVALYAVYNPETGIDGLVAVNATASVAPTKYAGAPLPGFTFSSLLTVWPTTGSGQFQIGLHELGLFTYTGVLVLSTTGGRSTYSAFTVASGVPLNAKQCQGSASIRNSQSGVNSYAGLGGVGGIGAIGISSNPSAGPSGGAQSALPLIPLTAPQTLHYILSATSGVATLEVVISGYKIY